MPAPTQRIRREVKEGRERFEEHMERAGEHLDEQADGGRTRELLLDLAAHSHHAAIEQLAGIVDTLVERIEELETLKELPRQLAELQSDVHENMGGCRC